MCGANVWSCCGGLPPRAYVGQKLALCFAVPHSKHCPVERRSSKIYIETPGAGGKPDHCPLPPDLSCLFDPDWLDLPPPVVSAGSQMNGR